MQEIVVLIQDVCWNYEQINKSNDKEDIAKHKQASINNFTNILKLIPKTKKDHLVYKNYSDVEILKVHTEIIIYVQEKSEDILKIFREGKYIEDNHNILENITNEVLRLSALLSALIQERQKKLSE